MAGWTFIQGASILVRSVYRTIPHQIAEGVRTDIYTGKYKENAELKEQELADQFMVSRGTIRSALMILVSEGVVKSVPNKGMRVCQSSIRRSPDSHYRAAKSN